MKKILFILLFSLVAVVSNAQNNITTEQFDSLVSHIEQLQTEYDYMSCEYELFKLKSNLDNCQNVIEHKCIEITIKTYHHEFNNKLYKLYLEHYNVSYNNFESTKELYTGVKEYVSIKLLTSNFTEQQIRVINSYFSSIDSSISVVESSLELYKFNLDRYKKWYLY